MVSRGLKGIVSNKSDESKQLGKGCAVTLTTILDAGESTQETLQTLQLQDSLPEDFALY